MAGIPTKRLLVYLVAGLLVLAVGTLAVVSMRGGASPGSGVRISAGEEGSPGSSPIGGAAPAAGAAPASEGAAVNTTEPPTIYVQVAGAVRHPGVYEMEVDARVLHAIQRAGGFAADADQEVVTLAVRLTDGCRVYVPRRGEMETGVTVPPEAPPGEASGAGGPVSINSATREELDSLPGIGPATADKIIGYREANGPFTSVEELTEVPGIGPAKLEQIRPLVTL